MNILKGYMRNWYYVGGVIFAVLALLLGLFGDAIDPMRRVMVCLFMCLILHEFEEYAWPGGFPSAWNVGVSGEKEVGDRYPLNVKSAFIVNVCCAYPIYFVGIIFCDVPVIAIFVAYFTMAQIFMHGLMMNKKMGALYNPGVATALLVNIPVGIYALWFIATNLDVAWWCWLAPILAFPFVAFLTILLPIKLCQDKETRYVFPKRDTDGFAIKGKSARLHR